MSNLIIVKATDLKLLLSEVPQFERHFLLHKSKAYNKIIELELYTCSLIFNLSLMNFDLFF